MADGRGGYRRPANPAPVSGPGRLSKRTDGNQPSMTLPDAAYGEQQAYQQAQAAAPMSQSGGGFAAQTGSVAPDLSGIVPMGAPTQNPDEPIMSGMPTGPGAGSTMAPQQPTLSGPEAEKLRRYIPTLILLASQDDTGPETKQFVRQLRAELG